MVNEVIYQSQHANPLWHSYLKNHMESEAWWDTVPIGPQRVGHDRSDLHTYIHTHTHTYTKDLVILVMGFPGGSEVKASAWNAGDPGSIPGSGRSPGEGNGNPLQYSCLENPWREEPGRLQTMG